MNVNPFKLMCESLGLSVRDVAKHLLILPVSTVAKYANGQRPTPDEVMEEMRKHIYTVDSAAHDFARNPKLLKKSPIPELLHKAVQRRILEIQTVQLMKRKRSSRKK